MTNVIGGYKAAPKVIDLAPHQTFAVKGRRGTEIRSLRGELWITQEGDPWDYVVPAGTLFSSGKDGLIVVGALNGEGRASISWRDPRSASGFERSAVVLDHEEFARLEQAARRARSEETARLIRSGLVRLARMWRRITERRRAASRLATTRG